MVEKAGDIEVKVNLQPSSYVWEIDSKYPKGHRLLSKENKKDTQQEQRNEASKASEKAKSNPSSTTNQLQTQNSRKCHES